MEENQEVIEEEIEFIKNPKKRQRSFYNTVSEKEERKKQYPFTKEEIQEYLIEHKVVDYNTEEEDMEMIYKHLFPLLVERKKEVVSEIAKSRTQVSSTIIENEIIRLNHLL